MLRSNRSVVLALAIMALAFWCLFAGWMFGASDPPTERYQSYRYAADKPLEVDPAASGVANAKTFEYRNPCREPKGRDESDLCAQWRAAYAAEDSASWAMWGFLFTCVGAIGLIVTINQSRIALDRAREANVISRESNRPWLKIEASPTLRYIPPGMAGTQPQLEHILKVANIGGSPAIHVDAHYCIVSGTSFQVDQEHERLICAHRRPGTFGSTLLQNDSVTFGEGLSRGIVPQRTILESSAVGRLDFPVRECDYIGVIVVYRSIHQVRRSYYVAAFFHVGGYNLPVTGGIARLIQIAGEYHGETNEN